VHISFNSLQRRNNIQQFYIFNQPFEQHAITKGVPGVSKLGLVSHELEWDLGGNINSFSSTTASSQCRFATPIFKL
jgi:hypothetical protein